ncbi:2-hydroxy-3-oxopropionate reductase [Pseudovibrio axinellae]|uniref:2-hydroxy-3-oxopropionate reductase n=1 Tax=Pseudovibrio axinellae TaxID=989403 RepID=A0A165TZ53_9HYPH|nr:NAD(P)-dependent oxidoreductase [Pseudovibrio axinellae]KZL08501.1 2-hydroxy-3-oxopropionate reductase [Pseudovibrio axinellae]SEP76421.1 3-hydroxyisobutyrate dehydrogenase [Pseudovibrio axinellae]
MAKVAFIGLGVMGYPMAGFLAAKGGHEVTVYNRTTAKAEAWVKQYGGSHALTPREAAEGCDVVFACVGNDDDLRSVTTGEHGAFHGMKSHAIFVDHTTASAQVARELDEAAQAAGFSFLDAPVSGGQAGAENGVLTVMIGGDEAVFDRAKPFIDCFAKFAGLMGPAGSGQMTKMVNQICIAGLVQGLSEAIHFAQKSGLDVEKAISAVRGGAAQSWQMENRWETMRDGSFEHGFAVDWMRKDLKICLQSADEVGARLPVTALVDQFYSEVQGMGGNRWDTSSLIARLNNADKK